MNQYYRDGRDFQKSGVIIMNANEGQVVWAREYIVDVEMLKWKRGKAGESKNSYLKGHITMVFR